MNEYLVNKATQVVHLRIDGRVFEECNTDDISEEHLDVVDADPDGERLAGLMGRGCRLCERCFPDGDSR